MMLNATIMIGKIYFYNILFFLKISRITIQITKVPIQIMPNPYGVSDNGIHLPLTFIPYRPEIMVGIAITNVMDVRYFITLFRRLLITEETSSLVPLMISR